MGEVEAFQPGGYFGRDVAAAAQLAVEFEELADLHFAVEAALLGKVADAVGAAAGELLPKTRILPRVGVEDVHDHAHGGGFARAVGAYEAVYRALGTARVRSSTAVVSPKVLVTRSI